MATKPTKAELEALLAEQRSIASEMVANPLDIVDEYLSGAGLENASAMFHLYRVVDQGKQADAFLFKCAPEDYDPEQVGKVYGSGTYRLKLYVKDDEHPRGCIRAAPKFAIEMPPGFVPRSASPLELAPVVQSNNVTREDIASIISQSLAAVLPQIIPKQATMVEQMEQLKMLAEIIRPAYTPPAPVVAPVDPMESMTKTLLMIKTLREEMPREPGENESPYGVIQSGLELFRDAMKNAARAPVANEEPAKPMPLLQNPDPNPAHVAGEPTQAEIEEMGMLLRMQVAMAIAAAKKDSDVESYAAIVYENVPEELLAIIETGVSPHGGDWFDELNRIHEGCAPHRPWFEKLRVRILEFIAEDRNGVEPGIPDNMVEPPTA